MVLDTVWAAAGMPARKRIPNYGESDGSGFLCIGCLEKRLDREVTPKDFTPVPINDPCPWDTERLAARKRRGSAVRSGEGVAAMKCDCCKETVHHVDDNQLCFACGIVQEFAGII